MSDKFHVNELVILKITDPEDQALNNCLGGVTAPFGGLPCPEDGIGVYLLNPNIYNGRANVSETELLSWGDEFIRICRENGVRTQKDIYLLKEAYRRWMMFNRDNKPLDTYWVGLGTPSQYKSQLFRTHDGSNTARINHWWVLTEKGVQVMEAILAVLPLPKSQPETDKLNQYLY